MVDLPNREDLAAMLAQRLAREFASIRRLVMERLGDPPDIARLTPELWREIEQRLNGAVLPALSQAFVDATDAQANALGVGVDFDLANERAQRWARQYTFELVRGVNQTSQRQLQTIISNFFDRGVTMGDTRAAIAQLYGPTRAEMIAQTEITRAAVEGERQAAAELEAQGVRLRPIHQTNVDDMVCAICGPRHGQEITDGRFPPLHPRCRCWVAYEVVTDETA